jgi:hypothetical protein
MPCNNHGPKCNGEECANKNVDNGLMTRIWGPSGWLFLHCVSFGYPYKIDPTNPEHLEKQNDYYRFFYYLGKVMPCKYCRNSYMDFFNKQSPISKLGSRKEFTKWLYDIHNMVNEKLGVPECEIPKFEEIEEKYQSFRASCTPLTTEQRNSNSVKGCTVPADGKSKRSVIKVVEFEKTPETTKPNVNLNLNKDSIPKSDDYIIIHKKTMCYIITLIILIICCYLINKIFSKSKK